MRILVVDDDSATLTALRAGLSSLGLTVDISLTPFTALALLDEREEAGKPVDLLISDLRMPGMHGLEFIRQARRRHPALQAVLMTAYEESNTRERARKAGCKGFLDKPFTAERVRRLIEEHLSASNRQQARDGQSLWEENGNG